MAGHGQVARRNRFGPAPDLHRIWAKGGAPQRKRAPDLRRRKRATEKASDRGGGDKRMATDMGAERRRGSGRNPADLGQWNSAAEERKREKEEGEERKGLTG
ncbi:hypothetical protein LIER_29724 [Lithospermum erythrorhizon]|uniref:Uncharacterized protein n=1 Tax=Lithospermum erythrorhizon TaxID=34254 RepID=A0AAV3RK85_LITER